MVDITQHYITMGNPENLGKSESPDSEPHTTDLSDQSGDYPCRGLRVPDTFFS